MLHIVYKKKIKETLWGSRWYDCPPRGFALLLHPGWAGHLSSMRDVTDYSLVLFPVCLWSQCIDFWGPCPLRGPDLPFLPPSTIDYWRSTSLLLCVCLNVLSSFSSCFQKKHQSVRNQSTMSRWSRDTGRRWPIQAPVLHHSRAAEKQESWVTGSTTRLPALLFWLLYLLALRPWASFPTVLQFLQLWNRDTSWNWEETGAVE